MVKVDKILGMKANAKGGLLYQILWVDGSKSWEPEDNVMDDDLVDDFEAAAQKEAYASDEIKAGSEVEVKNIVDGYENSWTAAKVTKAAKGRFSVEFAGFVDDKGKPETEGNIARDRLRLAPPGAPKGWAPIVGEIVELFEDDCWWEARVLALDGKKAKIQLRVSDDVEEASLAPKKMRPCSWLKMANKK